MKRFIIAFSGLVLLGGIAFAQSAPQVPNPPPTAAEQDDQMAAGQGQDDQPGWFHHGRRHHGKGRIGGPGGGMMMGKGFGLMLGNGQGLRINCGDEPMKQCIEAAQPLIDALNKANPGQTPVTAPKAP